MESSKQKQNFIKISSVLLALLLIGALMCGCVIQKKGGEVSITVVQSPIRLIVGESVTLKVETSDPNAEIMWYVGDESIATVQEGVITGVGVGETQVVVDCNNIASICNVVVSEKPETPEPPDSVTPTPGSVIINLSPITVEVGKCVVISAISTNGQDVKWYSVDSGIATVKDGVITGVSVGETM